MVLNKSLVTVVFIICFSLSACFFEKKRKEGDPAKKSTPAPTLFQKGERAGVFARVTLSHGALRLGREIPLELKLSRPFTILSFPSNGLIAGGEIRISPDSVAVIDSTTRRVAHLPPSRLHDFLGLPRKAAFRSELLSVRRLEQRREWTFRFTGSKVTHTLTVEEDYSGSVSQELLRFIFLPVGGDVPAVARDLKAPVMWSWTTLRGGKQGSVTWKLMLEHPARFSKNDLVSSNLGYSKISLAQLMQGYTKNTVVSQNSVQLVSKKRSGVIYLNGEVMDFLTPGNTIFLSLKRGGKVAVYPLFGGIPLVERYMSIPLEWEIR